jgi:hypothetical protein
LLRLEKLVVLVRQLSLAHPDDVLL